MTAQAATSPDVLPPPVFAAASQQSSPQQSSPHMRSIMRIPVEVRVFLGAATMPVAELMALERGAVVPLDHRVSDPVDVVVNGRVIARGELIALDDDPSRIGVKLIEIVGHPGEVGG